MDSTRSLLFYSCDIETLGVHLTSPIIEIGITGVHYDTDSGLFDYETVSSAVAPPMPSKRFLWVDAIRTAAWHAATESGRSLIAESLEKDNEVYPTDVRQTLYSLCTQLGTGNHEDALWYFRGPQFDEAMLRAAPPYGGLPWKYYNVRCQRTVEKTLNSLRSDAFVTVDKPEDAHRAGPDAEYQARRLVNLFCDVLGDSHPDAWKL